MRICVIGIGDSGEARLLRDILENQGHEVRLVPPGRPSEVFQGFDFLGAPADTVIIAAHGDEKGIVFPEMAPGVDALELPDDRITPEIVREHLHSAPPLVLSTACGSGSEAFAKAFTASGAKAYLAPEDYPDGPDIAIWVAVFFRAYSGGTVDTALLRANAAVGAESAFQVFR